MRKKRTKASRRFVKLISLFFFLSLFLSFLGSLPVGEKQSQESYGKTQATRNEGQNPCASKDAAAVAERREGQEEQKVRGGERANEKKQRYLRRKGEVQRSGRERKRLRETRRACKREKQREKERKREREGGKRDSPSGRRGDGGRRETGERRVKLLRVSCACSTLPPRPLPPPPLDRLT